MTTPAGATYLARCAKCRRERLHIRDGGRGVDHVHSACLACGHAPCCGVLVPAENRSDRATMSGPTPGPWRVVTAPSDEPGFEHHTTAHVATVAECRGVPAHVCRITGWGQDYARDGEQQANARLLAAAPAMLAALLELLAPTFRPCPWCKWIDGHGECCPVPRARAALAAATEEP